MVRCRHARRNDGSTSTDGWLSSHAHLQIALLFMAGFSLWSAPPLSAFQLVIIAGHHGSSPSASSSSSVCQRTSGRIFLAAGQGMGKAQPASTVAGSSSSSSKNKKANKSTSSSRTRTSTSSTAGRGSGTATSTSATATAFNVNAALAQLEKRYDELQKAAEKAMASDDDATSSTVRDSEILLTEYIVAARATGYVDDWVPIAQLCVSRGQQGDISSSSPSYSSSSTTTTILPSVVSMYRRELSHVAIIGSPRFQSVPRPLLQYAVEPEQSFRKFVYDPVVRGDLEKVEGEIMTRAMAKQVLELEDLLDANGSISPDDKSRIKSAYRKKSFQHHPDRFIGKDQSVEEATANANTYSQVQRAYETLVSGAGGGTVGSSWYASLGGRARTDFIGPVELIPIPKAVESVQVRNVECALIGLEPSVVQEFLARSLQMSNARKQ